MTRVDDEGAGEGGVTGPVLVPQEVFEGIEAIRQSGLTNMLDRPMVAQLAAEMGYPETSRWVQRHRDLYARAIFHGLKVEKEGGEA